VSNNREHLDAETVAAWIDGGLDAASLAAAEAHASNCDRCQALLATVAQTLPAQQAAPATEARGAFGFWKWLTPLAAAAAAVTIWMVVPQDSMQPERKAAPQSDVAAAPSPVVPVAPPVIPESAAKVAPPAVAEERFAESKRVAPKEDAFHDRELKREDARQEVAAAAPAPPPPAAPLPTPSVAEAPAARAADNVAAGATLGAVAQSRLQKATVPIAITSPDSRYRWRVLTDTIEHSQDGGRTWIPVRLLAGDTITAGFAPGGATCWLAGERGVVLLATDGTNFTRLPFPERVDLTSITATDARRATVTTADGRTFETTDNGRNWRNP
jgi:hypothetical protein